MFTFLQIMVMESGLGNVVTSVAMKGDVIYAGTQGFITRLTPRQGGEINFLTGEPMRRKAVIKRVEVIFPIH